jgi:hypothetical protein
LPGDERGWVEKPDHFREPYGKLKQAARQRMTELEFTLSAEQRAITENTIAEHCRIRSWHLHAVNCRAQYAQGYVLSPLRGGNAQLQKSQAKSSGSKAQAIESPTLAKVRQKWWTQRGSKRWLYDEASLEAAIRYSNEFTLEPVSA